MMNSSNTTIDLETVTQQLEAQGPEATLRWAISTFGEQLAVATGFGPSGIVILHLVSRINPDITVFYLETNMLFGETYALRDQLQARLGLKIQAIHPELSLQQQADRYGEALWRRDPDLCCYLRKVEPLRRYLADKQAWVTGIRRDQTPIRAATQVVEWDDANGLIKVNPLAAWTSEQVWNYIQEHDLPFNPLHRLSFPSLGCWPCTRSVLPGEHPRAGRWDGFTKTECGLHLNGNNGNGHFKLAFLVDGKP
jgi:phosphoadenosine phosphosulfate reductase